MATYYESAVEGKNKWISLTFKSTMKLRSIVPHMSYNTVTSNSVHVAVKVCPSRSHVSDTCVQVASYNIQNTSSIRLLGQKFPRLWFVAMELSMIKKITLFGYRSKRSSTISQFLSSMHYSTASIQQFLRTARQVSMQRINTILLFANLEHRVSTGSGKTLVLSHWFFHVTLIQSYYCVRYTMGNSEMPLTLTPECGIIPRLFQNVFERINRADSRYVMKISYLEVRIR